MTRVPDDDLEHLGLVAGRAAARAIEQAHLAGATLTLRSHGTTVVLCDPAGSSR